VGGSQAEDPGSILMWTLIVRPEAERDMAEAYDWYERQRPGLGEDFLLRVEAGLDSIRNDPHLCANIYLHVKRKLIRRFPYGLFYVIAEERVSVLAVMHAKRHPRHWLDRN